MNPSDFHFTIKEVETLCQLYLDCQLSTLEETELEYVLMHYDFKFPLINETRGLMEISRRFELKAAKPRKSAWGWILRAAACVAIILGTFAIYHHDSHVNHVIGTDDCIVYVAGKMANAEEAHRIAEADVAKIQQFMQTVSEQQAQEEAKVEQFINQINQSK
ncbi:MAG: hypothetical protein IK100_01555 [Muribaculaceae bacterium]|nr:hypothetical protein [Muribaculaceae bacterium]